MERTGLKASEPTHFTVDCTDAGEGKSRLGCSVVSESQIMQGGDYVLFHASFPYLVEKPREQNIAENCDLICYIS